MADILLKPLETVELLKTVEMVKTVDMKDLKDVTRWRRQ